MEKRIKVSKPLSDNMGESFKVLLDVLKEVNELKSGDNIILDLSKLDFVFPFLILPLSTLTSYLKNKEMTVNFELNNKCSSYLETIYFPNGFNPLGRSSWKSVLQSYSSKTYLPICLIPSREDFYSSTIREDLVSIFENILVNQLRIDGQLKITISFLLFEAISNIVDHAKLENGYIMVQNYPKKDFLDVCIADHGIGILSTYNQERFSDIETDIQALKSAVTGKSTKDQAITRGYGISTSRKMLVKGLQGKYFLFSGNAFYFYSDEQEVINELDNSFKWNGTIVALRIPKNIPKDFKYSDYTE